MDSVGPSRGLAARLALALRRLLPLSRWPDLPAEVRVGLATRFLPSAVLGASVSATVLAALVGLAYWPSAQPHWLLGWVGVQLAVGCLGLAVRALERRAPSCGVADADRLLGFGGGMALVLGASWGGAALWLIGSAEPWQDTVFIAALIALCGGAAAYAGSAVLGGNTFLLPALGGLIVALVLRGGEAPLITTGVVALTGAVLGVLAARSQSDTVAFAEHRHRSDARMRVLTQEQDRLSLVLEAAPFPVVVTSAVDGRVLLVNEFAAKLFSIPSKEAVGTPAGRYYADPAQRQRFLEELRHHGVLRNYELLLVGGDGEPFWALMSASLTEFEGEQAIVTSFADISAGKRREAELARLASLDPLTEALNRRDLMQALILELERAGRYGHPVSVLMLDLDHFKEINDLYGHAVGDQALRQVVALCRRSLRSADRLGRIGGEEFAVVLPETDSNEAVALAERLREGLAREGVAVETYGRARRLPLTVSVGVAESQPGDDADALLQRADEDLYRAKRAGRNRVVCSGLSGVPRYLPR